MSDLTHVKLKEKFEKKDWLIWVFTRGEVKALLDEFELITNQFQAAIETEELARKA